MAADPRKVCTVLSRPANQARTAATHAVTVARLIDVTLTNLGINVSGYPTSTPGASAPTPAPIVECPHPECTNNVPCEIHSPQVGLTSTERLAGQRDQAQADLETIGKELGDVTRRLARIAGICQRWAFAGVNDATVAQILRAIDSEIWCANCAQHGFKNPRLEDRTECDFCSSFRRTNPNNYPAPKELLDIYASGRKVNSNDVARIMTRLYGPRWNKAAPTAKRKQRKGKAA
jgi:hypothetical protein